MYVHKNHKKFINKCMNCLEFSKSKDETRLQLNGVIHYSKLNALISCDGHVLTFLKSFYDNDLKDVIITDNYQTIRREYPRVENVMKDPSTLNRKLNKMIFKIEKHHAVKGKINELPTFIYFFSDGIIGFDLDRANDTNGVKLIAKVNSHLLTPLADGSEYVVGFDVDDLQKLKKEYLLPIYMSLNFSTEVDIEDSHNFENFYIVMPSMLRQVKEK
jgi:hypothetical protein